ncbi:three-Cys-motif partner protein TcmP [Sphingomonas cavernae]|uniref:Three-Cys-motif partner protein TcmP n=1 Tax=Sphingomonas cavernae TaxID=2320861 RepID=A0A418WS30_9SPHN|nr:three-Cys-motif partner protein TcmP [Sphingomonas cavernae]RJF94054.1 three-Cys-motif partner protein TcmP [Sphingomonas cavernae]
MGHSFFDEQRDQSLVKAAIVSKYFDAWSRVMIANASKGVPISRLAYIDLFAGPGRYKDGTKSTPLMVLERAIAEPALASRLVAMFNDADPDNVESLTQALHDMEGVDRLKHPPRILCTEIGVDAQSMFTEAHGCPTFSFIDPFGYKGLSRGIIQSVIREWGCDCIFFFNYSRINAGINNDAVRHHMDALFGSDRIEKMRAHLQKTNPVEREAFVLEELAQALKEMGATYMLPFRFRRPDGSRTSHALVFVTKHPLGYSIMKGIMAGESSTEDQGVPSFEYSPADARCPMLFSFNRPLDSLAGSLLENFAGRTMSMKTIFETHNIGTPFVEKNYKQVLNQMEVDGGITANPPASARPMRKGERTFSDKTVVTFPAKAV